MTLTIGNLRKLLATIPESSDNAEVHMLAVGRKGEDLVPSDITSISMMSLLHGLTGVRGLFLCNAVEDADREPMHITPTVYVSEFTIGTGGSSVLVHGNERAIEIGEHLAKNGDASRVQQLIDLMNMMTKGKEEH